MKPVREMKDQLYKYMDVVQKLQDEYFERAGFTHSPSDYIQVHFGSKYAKVIKRSRGYDNDGK